LAGAINKIERIRRQLLDLKAMLKSQKDKQEVITAVDEIHQKFVALEGKLTQLQITGTGQDDVRFPAMLAERIGYLASVVAVADFPPTDQHMEVHKILQDRLVTYGLELSALIEGEFAEFIKLLGDNNVSIIITD